MLQNGNSRALMQRLPLYLNYLRNINLEEGRYISAAKIAHALDLGEVQVRKDLASVSNSGRPKIGYEIMTLMSELESYLGCDTVTNVIVVGAGRLGKALLSYQGFSKRGIDIIAGFDNNPELFTQNENKNIYSFDKMKDFIIENKVEVAILTVPASQAQEVFDFLISIGIKKVWNFAPTRLVVPKNIQVQNEDMVNSLAILIKNIN